MEEINKKRPTDADQRLVSPTKRSRFSSPREPQSSRRSPSVGSNHDNNNDASHNIKGATATTFRDSPFEEETSSDAETSSDDDASSSLSENINSNVEEDNDNNDQSFRPHPEFSETSIPYVSGRQKPRIHRINQESEIFSRLSSFLPKLKDANEDLQKDIAAGRTKDITLDEVDEDEEGQYVEMNLGLGVLEEKRNDDSGSKETETSDSENEDEDENDKDPTNSTSTSAQPQKSKKEEANVLGKLMGNNETGNADKPAIEEINN